MTYECQVTGRVPLSRPCPQAYKILNPKEQRDKRYSLCYTA